MIYISTSCVKSSRIDESVTKLVDSGFTNIELSGGTENYIGFENDLIKLKKEHNINYLLHNYFPPPNQHFVLNLASLNDKIYNESLDHYKRAIELSETLGADRYGLHAGFLIDPNINELGKSINKQKPFNREKSINRFCNAYNELQTQSKDVAVYIENNVFSHQNQLNFGFNPFLLTNKEGYFELSKYTTFSLLLDVAHLKVSCKTLGLNFNDELKELYSLSNYIHLSDNDGFSDSNKTILKSSEIELFLKAQDNSNKNITLEIYDDLEIVKTAYNQLKKSLYFK